jgi:hypothetical protein
VQGGKAIRHPQVRNRAHSTATRTGGCGPRFRGNAPDAFGAGGPACPRPFHDSPRPQDPVPNVATTLLRDTLARPPVRVRTGEADWAIKHTAD